MKQTELAFFFFLGFIDVYLLTYTRGGVFDATKVKVSFSGAASHVVSKPVSNSSRTNKTTQWFQFCTGSSSQHSAGFVNPLVRPGCRWSSLQRIKTKIFWSIEEHHCADENHKGSLMALEERGTAKRARNMLKKLRKNGKIFQALS